MRTTPQELFRPLAFWMSPTTNSGFILRRDGSVTQARLQYRRTDYDRLSSFTVFDTENGVSFDDRWLERQPIYEEMNGEGTGWVNQWLNERRVCIDLFLNTDGSDRMNREHPSYTGHFNENFPDPEFTMRRQMEDERQAQIRARDAAVHRIVTAPPQARLDPRWATANEMLTREQIATIRAAAARPVRAVDPVPMPAVPSMPGRPTPMAGAQTKERFQWLA